MQPNSIFNTASQNLSTTPTYQDLLSQTNPTGTSFNGGSAGLTYQTQPSSTTGVTGGTGGSALQPGTANYGSYPTTTNTQTAPSFGGAQTLSSGGTAGSAILGQAYDASMGQLQGQHDQIDPLQQRSTNDLNAQVDDQSNITQHQYQVGQANHQLAQGQLDSSHANSMRDLGAQLRGALAGYQQQVGLGGGGNSSANQLIGYALSQQGTQKTNDLNTDYNNQQTGLNVAGASLDQGYHDSMKQLTDYRSQQLDNISQTYLQQKQQLESQMSSLGVSKAYALQANQQLAQGALDQLKQLEGTFTNGTAAIAKSYQVSQNAPQADLSGLGSNFNVQQQQNPGLQALSLGANQQQNNDTGAALPVSLQRQPENLTRPF